VNALFAVAADDVAVTSDDCYTPRWVFDAMGLQFDLDVAAPVGGPWHVPCKRYYTAEEDGLSCAWDGLVWCNPPYSNYLPWAERWAVHPTGVLMGIMGSRSPGRRAMFGAADAVAFINCIFPRPAREPLNLMQAVYVAFRGVGADPAERLAAANKHGAVLYGRAS
jgi:hypothetical protein